MDLKELLGEELYNQVMEKAGDSHKIDIVSNGNWFPKEKFDQVNNDNKELKKQLQDRDDQLTDLKKKAKGSEELQQQIEKQIQQQAFDHALEKALSQSKARNTTAVKSLLELDKIKLKDDQLEGLDDQLKKVKEENPFLFEEEQQENDDQQQQRPAPQFSQGQHQKPGDVDPFVAGLGLKGGNE